jgi:hypothetical protein
MSSTSSADKTSDGCVKKAGEGDFDTSLDGLELESFSKVGERDVLGDFGFSRVMYRNIALTPDVGTAPQRGEEVMVKREIEFVKQKRGGGERGDMKI